MHFGKLEVSVELDFVVVCKSDLVFTGDVKSVSKSESRHKLGMKTFEGIAYAFIISTVPAQWSYAVRVPNLAMLYRSYHVPVFAPNPNELLKLFHVYHGSVRMRIA